MMDQCFFLGVCLGWSIFIGLTCRVHMAALAGGALFLNWWVWSFVIMGTGDWEPWAVAAAIDTATALFLWRVCCDPFLAASSAALVIWHLVRAQGWIGYDIYYDLGWLFGMAQAGFVAISAWRNRHPARVAL